MIHVTQEHIDWGDEGNCKACPIAMAVADYLFPRRFDIRVASNFLFLADDNLRLPLAAQKFIDAFDSRNPVEPFEFEFPALDAWIKEHAA